MRSLVLEVARHCLIPLAIATFCVELSGFATSDAEKQRAADIARGVKNVKMVRNNIVVKAPS